MRDEAFPITAGTTNAERLLIDQIWADMLRQNRWRRRGWRLFHRLRALSYALIPALRGKGNRKGSPYSPLFLGE